MGRVFRCSWAFSASWSVVAWEQRSGLSPAMPGRLDALLMRVTDTTLSFPIILFAILLVVILGGSLLTVVCAVALVLWGALGPRHSGEVLSIRERDFVAQARIAGSSFVRIMMVHLFPNVLNTLVVLLSLQIGRGSSSWRLLVELSWRRCASANANLGLDDRRRPGWHRQRLVGLALPRPGHSGDRARFQSVWRLAAGCPGPDQEASLLTSSREAPCRYS